MGLQKGGMCDELYLRNFGQVSDFFVSVNFQD